MFTFFYILFLATALVLAIEMYFTIKRVNEKKREARREIDRRIANDIQTTDRKYR